MNFKNTVTNNFIPRFEISFIIYNALRNKANIKETSIRICVEHIIFDLFATYRRHTLIKSNILIFSAIKGSVLVPYGLWEWDLSGQTKEKSICTVNLQGTWNTCVQVCASIREFIIVLGPPLKPNGYNQKHSRPRIKQVIRNIVFNFK